MSLKQKVLATMKSRDTESDFELYVTRTPGYLWAVLFKHLHVHPIAVTLMSIIIGAAAGICFFSTTWQMNLLGVCLLIWANWYDCADGQLARMTGKKTLIGRILDGFAGDVWFFFIYLAIVWRLWDSWGGIGFILCAYAGLVCHAEQCALADYYRNIHLWFQLGKDGSELDTSLQQRQEKGKLHWNSREWFHKLYLHFYAIYTKGQEKQTPKFQQLYKEIQGQRHGVIPAEMRERFRQKSLPLMPLTNILTFDTRAIVLFIAVLTNHVWIFPVFEATVLDAVHMWMRRRHEKICAEFYNEITNE